MLSKVLLKQYKKQKNNPKVGIGKIGAKIFMTTASYDNITGEETMSEANEIKLSEIEEMIVECQQTMDDLEELKKEIEKL